MAPALGRYQPDRASGVARRTAPPREYQSAAVHSIGIRTEVSVAIALPVGRRYPRLCRNCGDPVVTALAREGHGRSGGRCINRASGRHARCDLLRKGHAAVPRAAEWPGDTRQHRLDTGKWLGHLEAAVANDKLPDRAVGARVAQFHDRNEAS